MTSTAHIPTGAELDHKLATARPAAPWVAELCQPVLEAIADALNRPDARIWHCRHVDTAPVIITPLANPGGYVCCPDCASGRFRHDDTDPCDGCGTPTPVAFWRAFPFQVLDFTLYIVGSFCTKCLMKTETPAGRDTPAPAGQSFFKRGTPRRTPAGPGEATPE